MKKDWPIVAVFLPQGGAKRSVGQFGVSPDSLVVLSPRAALTVWKR